MTYLKQQRGAALIVVLLTIAIIGVMVPSIMSNITSSAKQFERSEEYTQLNMLTDMGIDFVHAAISDSSETSLENTESALEQGDVTEDDVLTYFREQIDQALRAHDLNSDVTIDIGEESGFTAEINAISTGDQSVTIEFSVIPILEDEIKEDDEETGSKTIELEFN